MSKTFHHDRTPDATASALVAGDVIRLFDGAFGDAVILGFDDDNWAKLDRPYAYASGVGTTGPTVLLGHEPMIIRAIELARYEVVETNRRGGGRVT